jgi:phosphatidylglycerophosphate synthase
MSVTRPLEVSPSGRAEEWIDERLHRPLAAIVVQPLVATPLTPNQVTALAGLAGIAAGGLVFLGESRPPLRLAAAALLFAAVVLDCVDGQLARARGTASKTGDMFDGLADLSVNLSVLSAVTYTLVRHFGASMWILGAVAMISYGLQCSLFDFAKRTYLARTGARPLPTGADFAQIASAQARAREEGRRGDAFLLWFYRQYFGTHRSITDALPGFAPLALTGARMRAWTWLGLGTHLAVVYTALALSSLWAPALLVAMIVFLAAGNLLLLVLLRSA